MLASRNKGVWVSLFSFAVSFISTNYLLKVTLYRKPVLRTKEEQLNIEVKWRYTPLDSRTIDHAHPRDEFVYTLQPWKVMKDIANNSFLCNGEESKAHPITILVMVKSAVDYTDRRNSVRETWGRVSHIENVVIHVVFVIGMAVGESQKRLEKESEKEGDVLQFIGVDDYSHIAFKVLAGMQWTRDNVPKSMLYSSADDDLMPNLPLFAQLLRKQVKWAHKQNTKNNLYSNHYLPIICAHAYRNRAIPVRQMDAEFGKYFLNMKDYPLDFFPPFCFGGWYIMSFDRVADLYEASRKQKAIHMDDVWITGILRTKVNPSSIEPMYTYQKKRGFGSVISHFEGDFQEDKNITQLMRKSWEDIWKDVVKVRHCTRR